MPTLRISALLLLTFATPATLRAADPLQQFDNCTLEVVEWADGDSFSVKLPTGKIIAVRLYGVDCLEINREGDTPEDPFLHEQRRWFGIADIHKAESVGDTARKGLANILSKPFTVHTDFAEARDETTANQVYGFVTTASGLDLAEQLVKSGMARTLGVYRDRPDGASAAEWRDHLRDLELLAARNGAGAWAHTDWEKLPEERRLARAEEAEMDKGMGAGQKLAPGTKIDPNVATLDQLNQLPGVGESMAQLIIDNRPYRRTQDLLKVPGIGENNLEDLRPYLDLR